MGERGMCGIAGFVGGFQHGLAEAMNRLQAHRGPDGRGVFEDDRAGVALAHVRLAVLDLTSAASQPMSTPDGRFVLVYNGEIYNYAELRDELEREGVRFASTGDTEVLLRGLERRGEDFLPRLNGMFSFALWDGRERELLLVRDPVGVKPLYYAEPEPGSVIFASEIKALFACPAVRREPDFEALLQHLAFCHASGDRTAFRGIRRIPPGTLLRWKSSTRRLDLRRYWRPAFGGDPGMSRKDAVENLRRLLQESSLRQLVSDVPVGSSFSGGIDSTLITAFAASGRDKAGLSCYTITYPESENELDRAEVDTLFARRAAIALGLRQTEREIKPDVVSLWPALIYHLDEPLADPAAIACYLISKMARENGTTVLLSGQGGDELFAGYPRHQAMIAAGWADRAPGAVRRLLANLGGALPGVRGGRAGAALRRTRRFLSALGESPDRRFLSYCASTPSDVVLGVLSEDVRQALLGRRPEDSCLERMQGEGRVDGDRWLDRDLSVYLPNHNLLYTDKMGMAVGLETRVPLLDMTLVNAAVRYPLDWKISRGVTKAVLRDASRGTIPDEVIDRPKGGFGAPYRKWLRHDLSGMWEDLTAESVVKRRGWFDPAALRRARDLSQSGKQDLYMLQWAVLTIELWARCFIDENPAARGRESTAHVPG